MSRSVLNAPDVVRCPHCDNVLGQLVAGAWVIRHRGREWVGTGMVSVRCEVCARSWTEAQLTAREYAGRRASHSSTD